MVPIGTPATGGPPRWAHIVPQTPGTFYWSGTKTLIFSPDVEKPFPFATKFTVHVDAAATSVAGRTLGEDYEFTFTTPTPRVLEADWYRKTGRFDSPVVIALRFNQPVRADDVVAHARVALTRHDWRPPALSAEAREWLRRTDPSGLDRFDAKVASVARAASASDNVDVRASDSWDEQRFPPTPERVVIETVAAPPPDAWLTVAIDSTFRGSQGPETHAPQSTVVRLEPTFFVTGTHCTGACDPSGQNFIVLTRSAAVADVARGSAIVDVTDRAIEQPVRAVRQLDDTGRETTMAMFQELGFARQPPGRTWRVRVSDDLKADDGQLLGYPWVGFVENAHERPLMALPGGVWEAKNGPIVPARVRNIESVGRSVTRVPASDLMPWLRDLRTTKPILFLPPVDRAAALGPMPDAIRPHALDVRSELSPGGTGIVRAQLWPESPASDPLVVNVPGNLDRVIQVTNLGISVKDSPQSTLVFVTRLDSGVPVSDARVTIVDAINRVRWRGATGGDGVALAPALALRNPQQPWDLSFIVTAEKDGDEAFVSSDWTEVNPSFYGLPFSLAELPALRGSVFTDRGVYKQGEVVHIKAVMRDETADGMQLLPAGAELDAILLDSRRTEVDRRTIRMNDWSSADWTWRVPDGAPLGNYQLTVSRGENTDGWARTVDAQFLVAAYRRPDFRVDAMLTADPPILGSTLHATVDAQYLFGGAVGARPVRWSLRGRAVQQPPAAVRDRYPDARYAIGYLPTEGPGPEATPFREKTETLGPDGRLAVTLTTQESDAAHSFTFEGDVENVAGQHIANRASLVVHPASLYVAVSKPPTFVDTTGTTLGVAAVDLSGNPLAGVPVTVSLVREQWVRDGRWIRREVSAGQWTVQTTAGETPLPIAVRDGGWYTLRAVARDRSGRQTRTELNFIAIGPGTSPWWRDDNRFPLTPERATWKPGETARILIQSPWPRATALLTVERDGIRRHRTFTVESTHDMVDVPITEADVPNVYVSVMLVKGRTSTEIAADGTDTGGPAYGVGYTELVVDDASKRLHVDVRTDRDEYRPRESANISVAVTAPDGKPAPGEVTLWAMDYGMLSLTSHATPDLVKAIYARRPLAVMTGDSRAQMIGLPQSEPRIAGLERGEYANVSASSATIMALTGTGSEAARYDFTPLVFWLGSAELGADGHAATEVTLPDSLTTYRIVAIAGDAASRFGFAEREIRVTKPLTLLPMLPRFLVKGDRASLGAVVTNTGTTAGPVTVAIESLDPHILRFDRAINRTIRLAPGASTSVRFEAAALSGGNARVRVAARLGPESDSVEAPLPVTVPLRSDTTAAYGETTSTATEMVTAPPGILPGAGGLTVELASTALVGLGESVRYLNHYPYDCAEQIASRALALLLASDVEGAFKLARVEPNQYRTAARNAVDQLYAYQCPAGGFSLWRGRCQAVSPYLTAYVLHVLKVAETFGVAFRGDAVDHALTYLTGALRQPPPNDGWWPVWGVTRAYAAKVLAEFGQAPREDIDRLAATAEQLPVFTLSYVADALAAIGDRGPRYQDIVRRMTNALRIDADRAHVEEVDDSMLAWLWNTNVRATAVVAEGLVRREDDSPFVGSLVRWLVAAREKGRWGTTHENAMALEALVAYYRAFERDEPQMSAAVKVGSTTAGIATFNGRSTAVHEIRMPMADLLKELAGGNASTLSISRTGTGRVHYTARVESFAPESPAAADRGFHVERRYEPYANDAVTRSATSFNAGDLIRVTLSVTVKGEGRYLALTDPLPAGFEPLEGQFATTALDLARETTRTTADGNWIAAWRRGDFDHVEKHDDRVLAFATRLGSGRHELSYLVRATTAGTFSAPGAQIEAMYAPELTGRSQAATVTVK